jgi:hypothetical protein
VILPLGLVAEGPGAVFLREGGTRAFVLTAGALRAEAIPALLERVGAGAIVAAAPTRARLDLADLATRRAAEQGHA